MFYPQKAGPLHQADYTYKNGKKKKYSAPLLGIPSSGSNTRSQSSEAHLWPLGGWEVQEIHMVILMEA